MLQIVHDVAPGADLAFATAQGGHANFAANILALRDAGARVIVDDFIYLREPMFQDGPIAQAVDTVTASGAAYFSAAGNDGRLGYDHASCQARSFPGAGTAHNFGSTTMQRISGHGGSQFRIVLQWESRSSRSADLRERRPIWMSTSSASDGAAWLLRGRTRSGDPASEILSRSWDLSVLQPSASASS